MQSPVFLKDSWVDDASLAGHVTAYIAFAEVFAECLSAASAAFLCVVCFRFLDLAFLDWRILLSFLMVVPHAAAIRLRTIYPYWFVFPSTFVLAFSG